MHTIDIIRALIDVHLTSDTDCESKYAYNVCSLSSRQHNACIACEGIVIRSN